MRSSTLIICFTILLVSGCSSGSPIDPGNTQGVSNDIPGIDLTDLGDMFTASGIMGAYELHLNHGTLDAELIPSRHSSIGESFIVSGTTFFTMTPCTDCLKIRSIELDLENNIKVNFHLRHPFQLGDEFKPPSARNRKDLDIFDVALLVRPLNRTSEYYPLTGETAYVGYCVNPDGYTREIARIFDPSDPAAIPYFLVIDDSSSEPPTRTFNEFPMGGEADFDTTFDLLSGTLVYEVYLTFGYGASARKATFMSPKYYNPEFNRKAAWKVNVIPPANPWQEGENDPTDTRIVTVEIYDWQTGAVVSTEENYELEPDTSKVYAASEVSLVSVEVFGVKVSTSIPTGSHTGMPDDPLVFEIPVANCATIPALAGEYTGLVEVNDSREPQEPGLSTRDFLIHTPDGILLDHLHIPEYATYQTFTAIVEYNCGPITGSILSGCPTVGVSVGTYLPFIVSAQSANGGNIIEYYADLDYDSSNPGEVFDKDFTFTPVNPNDDGEFTGPLAIGPLTNGTCGTPDPEPVTQHIAFMALDDCPAPHETVFAFCDVLVECTDPYKNIPLRDGVQAWDLAVDPNNGRVMIVYSDGLVFQYLRDNQYQVPNPTDGYFDSDWFNTVIPISATNNHYDCVPDKAYLAFSDNSRFILGYGMYINDWTDRAWYKIVNAASPAVGTQISHIVPHGNWVYSYNIFDVLAYGTVSATPNYMGCIWMTSLPNYNYLSYSIPSENYSTEHYAYHLRVANTGLSNITPGNVAGLEPDINESSFWVVENVDYYGSKWAMNIGGTNFIYQNSYFGNGTQSEDNDKIYAAKDLTSTDANTIMIIDKHSDSTYRIKAWDVTTSPGTGLAPFILTGLAGDSPDILDPEKIRFDCAKWNDPVDGNMVFVLHGYLDVDDANTPHYYLSIYRESELPASWF